MTAQILNAELSNLVQESKRKSPELRNAAEKSLQDLKGISVTSESQLAADLVRRPQFITPFLLACASKNSKFASSGAGCIQRLAISSALPKDRLEEVIEALRESSSFGLDVQLKILQTLSALTQNYSSDIRGDLLFGLLQVCLTLQASKQTSVSSSAAATLQQLIIALFESLEAEDAKAHGTPAVATVSSGDQESQVRPVAHDAFRIFHDLCVLTEGQKPLYLKNASLPQASGLELIESVLASHAAVFDRHVEQANTLRTVLMPFLIRSLSERQSFPVTVRIMRVLAVVIRRHLALVPAECEIALSLLNHMLDPEAAPPWKRALSLEVFRFIYNDINVLLQLCTAIEQKDGKKQVLRDNLAIFVRLASEKPSLIGLGQQSTTPSSPVHEDGSHEPASIDATGMTGLIGGGSSSASSTAPGISVYWSSVKTAFLDQLDKTEPPALPETYIYSLVLTCINNFSDSIAKFILPLTVAREHRGRRRADTHGSAEPEEMGQPSDKEDTQQTPNGLSRSASQRRRIVPVNPLTLEGHKAFGSVKSIAAIIEHSWPAVLASCSTFLYAALDNDYYRALVRSYQKFTQVAGLLRMVTPRDAFLTTLGKAAVPANIVASSMSPTSPVPESPSIFNAQKGYLSVDSLVHSTTSADKDGGKSSADHGAPALSARNLLCLRALLNIAIALGPTLEDAWNIICETLQQAEMIMATSTNRGLGRDQRSNLTSPVKVEGDEVSSQSVATEINAIQAAATRMFESSSDFPNESFAHLLGALCKLLQPSHLKQMNEPKSPPSPNPRLHQRRIGSFSSISLKAESQIQDYILALRKIGDVASLNADRFTHTDPDTSGWTLLANRLTEVACDSDLANAARRLAAQILSHVVQDPVRESSSIDSETRSVVQQRCFSALKTAIGGLDVAETKRSRDFDSEIHYIWLESLRSIIESSGDTITTSWDLVFDIILTSFSVHTLASSTDQKDDKREIENEEVKFKHLKLGRSTFDSTQLICSDFLRGVPEKLLPDLVDILFRFSSQQEDLNISLTMTTLFWNISDFLRTNLHAVELNSRMENLAVSHTSAATSAPPSSVEYAAGTWLRLLQRLVAITADTRSEVRNTAVHTTLRIFGNSDLSADSWCMCFTRVLIRMLDNNVKGHKSLTAVDPKTHEAWIGTSQLALDGYCDLLVANLGLIMQNAQWSNLWEFTIERFKSYLDLGNRTLHGIVYTNLAKVLSQIQNDRNNFENEDLIVNLWLLYSPTRVTDDNHGDTSKPYEAYISCFREFHRLFHLRLLYMPSPPMQLEVVSQAASMTSIADSPMKDSLRISLDPDGVSGTLPGQAQPSKLQRCVENLMLCVATSSAASYGLDTNRTSNVQSSVLNCLSDIYAKCRKAQPLLVTNLARAIALPFTQENSNGHKKPPTFVAFSKAAMQVLDDIVSSDGRQEKDLTIDALTLAIASLALPVELKYQWSLQGQPPKLWQKATTTAVTVLQRCLPHSIQDTASSSAKQIEQLWLLVVYMWHAIASADCSDAEDPGAIAEEEQFDIKALMSLRDLIIPALGSSTAPDTTRRLYSSSLLLNSQIHPPQPGEYPQLPAEPLHNLYSIRFGRTYTIAPVIRSEMAFYCFGELLALTQVYEDDDKKAERVALARAAAPYLILRVAMPLKQYIADQSLRGRMPQPSSERDELLFALRRTRELRSEPKAIPEAAGARTEHKRHLVRLYPLLTKAQQVAAHCRGLAKDDELIAEMTRWLEVLGDEFEI